MVRTVTPLTKDEQALIKERRAAAERRAEALDRYLGGETVTAIAKTYSLSKQRVSQMIKQAREERSRA
jgi:Mor family transcriptional regulator